eukprot:8610761-Ditylum_brightwellii.AAC.1
MSHFMNCGENKEKWTGLEKILTPVFVDHGINPVLQISIYAGVNNHDINTVKAMHNDIGWEPYERLIKQQTRIRWKQIRYGQFARIWSTQ